MVEREFVSDDFDQFIEFMKGEFQGKYRFLDVGPDSIYAYVLGAPKRLAYREKFNDGKNDKEEKIKLLKQQGFMSGYEKTIS